MRLRKVIVMRKKTTLLFGVLIAGLLVLGACSQPGSKTDEFALSYEALNGQKTSSGKEYMSLDFPDENVFETPSEEAVLKLLDEGTGVIYFGFPECPWCRSSILLMDEAAKAVKLESIYTVEVSEIRDTKRVDENGKIVTDKEGTEFYYKLLERLGNWAPEYNGLNDPTERRIHTPLVVVVVDGEIVASHVGTVEAHEDPFAPMTDEVRAEVLKVFKDMFSLIPGCGESATVC